MGLHIKREKGFTLIELVVVIAIVSVLIVVLIAVVNPATQIKKGRDTQRRNTLKQLQQLLEQYYNDHGSYPSTSSQFYASETGEPAGIISNQTNDWIPGLAPTYIQSMPHDPVGGDTSSSNPACAGYKKSYLYKSDGAQYILLASCSIEAASTSDSKDVFYDSTRQTGGGWVWKVCSGVTACSSW